MAVVCTRYLARPLTLEEENLENIIKELSVKSVTIDVKEKVEDMDTHVLLKYECDICKKIVMTPSRHKSIMHEKSLQRLERESKQQFFCEICDIKRNTEVLIKSHMKTVHGDLKRNLSEMRKPKAKHSPPNLSPPAKKAKENDSTQEEEDKIQVEEEDTTFDEEDLNKRMELLKRPAANKEELNTKLTKEIDNLERLLTASGEVIANLENENNQLHAKAEFYEEVAEGIVIENESLILKIQQQKEEELSQKEPMTRKEVTFNPVPDQRVFEEEEVEAREEQAEEEQVKAKIVQEESGFRQQSERFTCIVCGLTRNTKIK